MDVDGMAAPWSKECILTIGRTAQGRMPLGRGGEAGTVVYPQPNTLMSMVES